MLLPLFQALKIQVDPAHSFARYQWLDPRNRQLRPALEHGHEVSSQYRPHLALVDFTYLPPVSLADELWLSVSWFPKVVQLPYKQVAIVLQTEHLHNQMVLEAMLWVARPLVRFQLQLFDDVPSALGWLLADDLATALVLQAEWETSTVPATMPTEP